MYNNKRMESNSISNLAVIIPIDAHYLAPESTIITLRQSHPLMLSQNEQTTEEDLF